MTVCCSCGYRFLSDAPCRVEEYDQFVGHAGRHGGRCWGGRFPTADDMKPLPEVDVGAARERGAARHRQQLPFEAAA